MLTTHVHHKEDVTHPKVLHGFSSQLEIHKSVVICETRHNQMRMDFFAELLPVLMNNSIEQSSIPPRGSEVVTADTYIAFSHLLGPQQKSLLGRHVLGLSRHVDVRDLQEGKMPSFW